MWHYHENVIDDINKFPDGVIGFIYKITNIDTGKFYIGKKNLYSERNIKLGKKELAALAEEKKPGKKKTKKLVVKESDWQKYYGSEPTLKEDIKKLGHAAFKREIIEVAFSKKQLTYFELKYQVLESVLESENCYNSNILGKFFSKDLYI